MRESANSPGPPTSLDCGARRSREMARLMATVKRMTEPTLMPPTGKRVATMPFVLA